MEELPLFEIRKRVYSPKMFADMVFQDSLNPSDKSMKTEILETKEDTENYEGHS